MPEQHNKFAIIAFSGGDSIDVKQCFPTGAPWSPCALGCIAKDSAGDITNK